MLDSAPYFDIPADESALRRAVKNAVHRHRSARVRVCLSADGKVEVTLGPLRVSPGVVRLALDAVPIRSTEVARSHKTVDREEYEAARARHPGADDVVLLDERGELIGTTAATLAVQLGGIWYTPPPSAGALPGIERACRIETCALVERTLRSSDLANATQIAVLSSVSGWLPARLTVPTPETS